MSPVTEETHQRSLLIFGRVVIKIVLRKYMVSNDFTKRFQSVRIGGEKTVAIPRRFQDEVRVS